MGRYFPTWYSSPSAMKPLRKEAEITMQVLTTLAQHTSELYNEFHVLERIEQDYRRKLNEVKSLHLPRKGPLPVDIKLTVQKAYEDIEAVLPCVPLDFHETIRSIQVLEGG